MTWNRREVLGGLGIASAHALGFAFGCSAPARPPRRAGDDLSSDVRSWLHEAVALIHGAGVTGHALAVSREHTAAALDVLGAGVAHQRSDGVVLTAFDARGRREQVRSELTRAGVLDAARALVGHTTPASLDFGPPPPRPPLPPHAPEAVTDAMLIEGLAQLATRESGRSSRIVYASGLVELDDARVWSVAAGSDREQHLIRVRRGITRVAWNGTRPIVSELSRAWRGGIDDQSFSDDELAHARDAALALMTPGTFSDGEHALVLAPELVASIADRAARALFTTRAERRPEVAARLAPGAMIAAPTFSLVDDPTAPGAYGGFHFDDAGTVAVAKPIIDRGALIARIDHARRPGHTGPLEITPAHLRIAAGTATELALDDGYLLEGDRGVLVDPASDRIVVAVQRALEVSRGQRTGRAYADVELVGSLGQILRDTGEATHATRTIGLREERDDLPRWRSIEAPWLQAKGRVRVRRRFA